MEALNTRGYRADGGGEGGGKSWRYKYVKVVVERDGSRGS
jgi:hypothetical protein